MLVYWIWLAHRPGVTDRMKLRLLQHFSGPEDIYFADRKALEQVGELTEEAREGLLDKDPLPARKILEECRQKKLQLLTWQDDAYPNKLRSIPDAPVLLYYKGKLPDLNGHPAIGIVGTRKASAYGMQTAKRMGYQIARCGGIVVSGMAYGIDGMAAAGALTAGQTTVGVLGCGADRVYPVSNRALFADVEKFGCLISEFPPGTAPMKWNFPRRNRLISGMSCGVLVVEAPEKSGALITARQAADQGRDLFVVPGNIDIPTFVGSNRLLREGAAAVGCGWDVLSEYESLYPGKIHKVTEPDGQNVSDREENMAGPSAERPQEKVAQKPRYPQKKENLKPDSDKKTIDKPQTKPYIDVNEILPKLSEDQRAIVLALKDGQRLVDDVIAQTGLTTGKMLAALTMLELKGVIQRLPGKHIRLK